MVFRTLPLLLVTLVLAVFAAQPASAADKQILYRIDAETLAAGDYVLTVEGMT